MRHLLLFTFLLPVCLLAQDGLFPFTDFRSRAGGGTGLTSTGIDAIWTNPAGLFRAGSQVQGSATAEQRFGLGDLTLAGGGIVVPAGRGAYGLSLASFGLDRYRETRIGLAYGRQLSDNFYFGGELSGFDVRAENYAGRFAATFGLGFQLVVSEEIELGARIFSPFRVATLPDEYLPQLLAVGITYVPNELLRISVEAHQQPNYPLRIRSGLHYRPAERIGVLLGVATGEAEVSFGLEYEVLPRLSLGGGAIYHGSLGVSPAFGLRWE